MSLGFDCASRKYNSLLIVDLSKSPSYIESVSNSFVEAGYAKTVKIKSSTIKNVYLKGGKTEKAHFIILEHENDPNSIDNFQRQCRYIEGVKRSSCCREDIIDIKPEVINNCCSSGGSILSRKESSRNIKRRIPNKSYREIRNNIKRARSIGLLPHTK